MIHPVHKYSWWILVAMTTAASMILFNQTAVSVALPQIQHDLAVSHDALKWVVNAYILAFAATVAIGGRLGDTFGLIRVFSIGTTTFAVASVGCALALSGPVLIATRVVQGLGAALMAPATGAMISNCFVLEERGRAIAFFSGVSSAFLGLAPMLGGALAAYASWRFIFWFNLPVAAIVAAIVLLRRPQEVPRPARPVHLAGPVLLVLGAATFVLGLQQGNTWGWTSHMTLGVITGGLLLIGLFVRSETSTEKPLLELSLLRNRSVAASAIILFCMQFAMVSSIIFSTIFIRNGLGFGSMIAGAALLPLVLALALVSQFAGRLFDRIGVKVPAVIGTALMIVGLLVQAPVLIDGRYALMVPGLVILGIGIGFVMTPTYTDALNRVPSALRGQAAGILVTIRQMGGTIGVAMVGTLVTIIETTRISELVERTGGSSAEAETVHALLMETPADRLAGLGDLPSTWPTIAEDLHTVISAGIAGGFYLASGVLVVGFLVAAIMMQPGRQSDTSSSASDRAGAR